MELYRRLGTSPGSNPYAEARWEGDLLRLLVEDEVIALQGQEYVETGYEGGNGNGFGIGGSYAGRDYSFDYVLPAGEWVTLMIKGEQNQTSLYVNGELIDMLGNGQPFEEYATFVFPLERIGSKTHSFHGMIRGVEVRVEN